MSRAPVGVAFWGIHCALIHGGRAIHCYPGRPISLAWLDGERPREIVWLPPGIGLDAWEAALAHVGQPYTLCTELVGRCVGKKWGCFTPSALRATVLQLQKNPR